MTDFTETKKLLLKACLNFIHQKEATILQTIKSNKNDLFSETKSSAGDKHETGRAMIQLEMEKAGHQLAEINTMKLILDKIDIEKTSNIICLGSLIITNKANYFLAISTGKIKVNNRVYFAVSTSAPVGKQLLGKKVGDTICLDGSKILEVY